MMKLCILLLLVGAVHSALLRENKWSGEWGVHVSPNVDPQFLSSIGFEVVKKIGNLQDSYVVKHSEITTGHPPHLIEAVHYSLSSHESVVHASKQYKQTMTKRSGITFPDPLFVDQWHLVNTGQNGGIPGQDINVAGVWEMGITGRGVRIAVVDDGYQHQHPDLTPGYHPESSYNINDGTPDPSPGPYDFHGTAAAGVALASNNSVCGVGAAYGAEGSGIRLIAAEHSDSDIATALTFMYDVNQIYSNSWGPADNGFVIESPGYFTMKAIADALENGRGGLGSIYVWAAGNGLMRNDNCNYDGYVNHRGTIGVGAVGNDGKQSVYSEPCAAMLVTAPSKGGVSVAEYGITTTDVLGESGYDATDCTSQFGGTSSACPLVAGVVALMLEANPKLTWRDVQYILLSTTDKNDPNDTDWTVNGAGYHINHKYGFGRVNAFKAVNAARSHETLPGDKYTTSNTLIVNSTIPDNDAYNGVNATVFIEDDFVVEHVEVTVSIPNFESAGDLYIQLISPNGTKSVLAEQHGGPLYALVLQLPELDDSFLLGESLMGPPFSLKPFNGKITYPEPNWYACSNDISNCASLNDTIVMVMSNPICNYSVQILNAQACGARAVLVVDRTTGQPNYIYDSDEAVTIPTAMISLDAAIILQDYLLANGVAQASIAYMSYTIGISFDGWTFSTVRNWGESAKGNWTIQVYDTLAGAEGTFASWQLTVYGHPKKIEPGNLYVAPWIIGVIIGVVVILIFVTAGILYYRERKNHGGYESMP